MKIKMTILLLFSVSYAVCQNPADSVLTKNVATLTLDELMNIPITVGSQKTLSAKETPGSITVITEEMIRTSGARDLDELLMQVPGFSPANDYGNVISFGVRGNWANEGKILVMADGMVINETNYGSAPVTQRFPLSQIKQIEIIRGPGSVIYGGVAALAVVSIKTKSGEDLNGAQIALNTGVSNRTFARNNAAVSWGRKYNNGLMIGLHTGFNLGNNSNRDYRLPVGDSVLHYAGNSTVMSRLINAHIRYKNLNLRYVHEDLRIDRTNDPYGDKYTYFSGDHITANYSATIGKLRITPGIYFRSQQPWNILGGSYEFARMMSYRTMGNVNLQYEASANLDLMAGLEYYEIMSRYPDNTIATFMGGSKTFTLSNSSVFSEAVFHKKGWNASVGLRLDNHSYAGTAFVPRMAITKSFNKLHLKSTYSRAFKTPLVSNIQGNENIKPEYVTMLELESSYPLTKKLMITINLFDAKITESIIFSLNTKKPYINKGTTGTRGLETELRYSGKVTNLTLSYSYYQSAYRGVSSFLLGGSSRAFQGLSPHKITLVSSIHASKKIQINPSLMVLSKRTSLVYNNVSQSNEHLNASAFWGMNVVIVYQDLFTEGLSLQAGVHDVFNQQLVYLPAYESGLAPQPAQAREFSVGLRYQLESKR